MVPPCFEGAESISDLGLPQFQPLEGFCASVVLSTSSDFLLAIHFFWFTKKKGSHKLYHVYSLPQVISDVA